MLTPFNIYLIMQLDDLRAMLCIPLVLSLFVTVIGFIMFVANAAPQNRTPCDSDTASPWYLMGKTLLRHAAPVAVLSTLLIAVLPSSRSAATIVILPAVANNEAIQREAAELYLLAKEGLRNLIKEAPDDRRPTHDTAE